MTTFTAAQASQSRVFVAEGLPGPDNPPVFQGCLVMGSASQSFGDVEYIYCPDPEAYEGFVVVGEITGREEGVETGLSGHFPLSSLSDIVKWAKARTPLAIHCHFGLASNPQTFNVFEKAVIFDERARITSTDIEDMGSLEESSRIGQSASVSAAGYYEVVNLNYLSRVENLIDEPGTGVAIARLYDETLPVDNRFAYYVVAPDATVPSELIYSIDGGANWSVIALDTAMGALTDADVAVVNDVPVIVSPDTVNTYYVDVVGGSTTVVEVTGTTAWNVISGAGSAAYVGGATGDFGVIEDYTAAPTSLTIGAVGDITSVHALPGGIILAGDSTGYVFYSVDGVNFGSYEVSSGNAITAVCAVDGSTFWAGDAAGNLFYSTDAGATWASRGFPGSGAGQVNSIVFPTLSVGWLAHDPGGSAANTLIKTTGAGAVGTWVKVPISGSLPVTHGLVVATVSNEANLLLGTGGVDAGGTDGRVILGAPS